MEQRFAGQTVIVTGASGNIGEGIVRRFAAEGANVVLTAGTRTSSRLSRAPLTRTAPLSSRRRDQGSRRTSPGR